MNDYYILSSGQLNFLENSEIVENVNSIRWNNNKTKFIVKTKIGVSNIKTLDSEKKFTHKQILIELSKPEWNIEL